MNTISLKSHIVIAPKSPEGDLRFDVAKTLRPTGAGVLLVFLLFSLSVFAQTPEIEKLEGQKRALRVEIDNINNLLAQNKDSTFNTNTQLGLLRDQIKARMSIINLLDQEVSQLDKDIAAKGIQISRLEKELEKKKQDYAETVEYMYMKRNKTSNLKFILSASDFSQAMRRFVYLKEYSGSHKTKADEIAAKQAEVAAQKRELEKNKAAKASTLAERRKEELELEKEEKNLEGQVTLLQKEGSAMQADITKKQREEERISREIQRLVQEEIARAERERLAAEAAADKEATNTASGKPSTQAGSKAMQMTKEDRKLSANFAENKGKLPFPMRGSYRIINKFGIQKTNASPLLDCKGIEIYTTKGTDALCVFDGSVVTVAQTGVQPPLVLVKHGKFYTLYQNLGNVYVKTGDKVKRGQALGQIYTNNEDETILHFEIHEGSKVYDPLLWLNK